jgi:hypothetical protein
LQDTLNKKDDKNKDDALKNLKQNKDFKNTQEGIMQLEEALNKNQEKDKQKAFNKINNLNIEIPQIKEEITTSSNPNDHKDLKTTNQNIQNLNMTPSKVTYRIPVEDIESPYTALHDPATKRIIERFLYKSGEDPRLSLYKSFKKWKLQNIKPRTFLGKKDRKIRIRTRIYYDQPDKKDIYVKSRRVNEIISSHRDSTNSSPSRRSIVTPIRESPFKIETFNNKDDIKNIGPRRNTTGQGFQVLNDLVNKKIKNKEKDVLENLKDNKEAKDRDEALKKLNDVLDKKILEDEKDFMDNLNEIKKK